MLSGYAWVTANIMYQAPWDPVNFDREALKSDLEGIPQLVNVTVEVVNRRLLGYWKEADVWFEVTDENLTEEEVRELILEAIKSPNRAEEAVRRIKLAPEGEIVPGEVPSGIHDGASMDWQPIVITVLVVGFIFGMIQAFSGD